IFRHTLKLARVGAPAAASALAAPQSQDPPPPAQDPAKTAPPAQQQTGAQPVQQKDTVTPKNSKEDVEAIGNRSVGKGVNLFSLEWEISLGKGLVQEGEKSLKHYRDPTG